MLIDHSRAHEGDKDINPEMPSSPVRKYPSPFTPKPTKHGPAILEMFNLGLGRIRIRSQPGRQRQVSHMHRDATRDHGRQMESEAMRG